MIHIQQTPNPLSLKFTLSGRKVIEDDFTPTRTFFVKGDNCTGCPFAKDVLEIEGVQGVFLGKDFITITKTPQADWNDIRPKVVSHIENTKSFFIKSMSLMDDAVKNFSSMGGHCSVSQKIQDLIDKHIRPVLMQDGGDIVFEKYYDGVVFVKLQGACIGCPSSRTTLKHGVEKMLKHYIEEVQSVEQVL